MPDNYLMLGLIATLLPNAKVIHVRRDVRDTGLSLWLTHFRHMHWACDQEAIASRIKDYLRLMEHWRSVLPGQMLEVEYEAVVSHPEAEGRRMLAWCGQDWHPACAEPHKTERAVRTASMTQVREPVYQRSVQRWRNYEGAIAPLLQRLNDL
jgi:hypothetical protein